MAEVDGNRTRRTGIARPNRFEGGGAHQVLVHLRGTQLYRLRIPVRPSLPPCEQNEAQPPRMRTQPKRIDGT